MTPPRPFILLFALFGLVQSEKYNEKSSSVELKWIGDAPDYHNGVTFGVPWPAGQHSPNTQFVASDVDGQDVTLQSWVTGYWRDGSIKWTGHAFPPSNSSSEGYTIKAKPGKDESHEADAGISVKDSGKEVLIDTGKVSVTFPKKGNSVISSIKTSSGKTVGKDGKLVLHSQSSLAKDVASRGKTDIDYFNFESNIENVSVSKGNTVRALVTVRGTFQAKLGSHDDWLPFVLRFYFYHQSEAIRLVQSIVFDGDHNKDFLSGLGLRFTVPLEEEELYDRHVRMSGVNGGFLHEAVQGITGLRRDPGEEVRTAQVNGKKTPDIETWDERVSSRMKWIPVWNDFSLQQLTHDGFRLKKRTKPDQSWIDISAANRSDGVVYLGGATKGGIALGLRHFWQQYPSGLEVSNAGSDEGEVTLWLYSPNAEPLDMRSYHDGMGEDTYEKQLDALEITYEDFEPDFDTPYGIAKTSEITIWAFESTPASDDLSIMASNLNTPPALYPEPEYVQNTKALGGYWAVPSTDGDTAAKIESTLDFIVKFYAGQTEERRYYGFLHFGDFMHSYDPDRHTWRYDIGGYAWDNSELSPDLFFWQYFLRTGREDIYRFAETQVRHTGEMDVYHIGKWKGLGTRHGVQHWVDSAKQVRIAQPQYRKYFYFVSGGDERVGELLEEALDTDQTYGYLDPNRKVRTDGWKPKPGESAVVSLGTDWSALAAGWLIEWERRGPRWEEAREKLENSARGIAKLKNGFVTGSGVYDNTTGAIKPPPADPDNDGLVSVSHLSAMFGMPEVISELIDYWGKDAPDGFVDAWLDYCYYKGATDSEAKARYGSALGGRSLIQGHSRLSAYFAHRKDNETVGQRAWTEFIEDKGDGLKLTLPWKSELISGSIVLQPVEEAAWLSSNAIAQYGLAAIQDLALAGEWL